VLYEQVMHLPFGLQKRVELARALAFVSPRAEELKRRRRLWFRRRIRAISASNEGKYRGKRG